MSSLAPCLHEEADTIMFSHATEAAKRANKKISSRTVGTDVVVLVIHKCNSCEWVNCVLAKVAGHGWCEIKLSCFYSIHSQSAIKHLLSLVVENGGQAFQL